MTSMTSMTSTTSSMTSFSLVTLKYPKSCLFQKPSSSDFKSIEPLPYMPFEIVFNVPLECQSCVDSVDSVLSKIPEISKYDINLADNIVTTEGTLPPSEIVRAIQETGRDAIIRGAGRPNSAAVCILESFDDKDRLLPVKGLARIVSVGENDLFVDLTVNGLPKGTYYPSIRVSGDLSRGALSTGSLFHEFPAVTVELPLNLSSAINAIGTSIIEKGLYSGQLFLHADLKIDQLIGRSVVFSSLKDSVADDSLVGVIARSAGAWENDKLVCSCSGKTVWEERGEALAKGITS